eukprot:CAMPEP_0172166936 /NCGR_PEP_ID=MMETSP1050-20130122/9283_1 /TAXON_ID=233186 /ORGANISM="Cryptomonas curvata, Strain CCAP979/52" /LENGTH=60 /DNA_ID=CAMNT_0012837651 /DNA_START=57 /DNA_END=236 /DNA_ORIENTATION=+
MKASKKFLKVAPYGTKRTPLSSLCGMSLVIFESLTDMDQILNAQAGVDGGRGARLEVGDL